MKARRKRNLAATELVFVFFWVLSKRRGGRVGVHSLFASSWVTTEKEKSRETVELHALVCELIFAQNKTRGRQQEQS